MHTTFNGIIESKKEINPEKTIEILESRAGNPPDRTLKRIKKAIDILGIKPIKMVNVVGTNGKGTVASAIYNVLKVYGLKVGLYTSPHLVRYTERIMDSDGEIEFETFIRLVDFVTNIESELIDFGELTYFEVLTLVAFIFFNYKNEEFLVIEAGVGGATDATKAFDGSILQILTSISIDHADYLGNTIYDIAKNKSGIMNGTTAITMNEGDAIKAIEEYRMRTDTKLYKQSDFKLTKDGELLTGENLPITGEFSVEFMDKKISINPKQLGIFRVENYALAFAGVVTILKKLGLKYEEDLIKHAINTSVWNGRTQVIHDKPMIIVDGAHNYDAIKKLFETLDRIPHKKTTTVFAIMSRKDHKTIGPIVRKNSDNLIVTTNGNEKSLELEILKTESNADFVYGDLSDAIKKGLEISDENDLIVICGSLYLVGEVLKLDFKNFF
ncbi:MAG: Mur ligase family protein [Ezakiella sp.]|nr:Mur ligase family protein [Ezakiella sp.]MDD7472276.1 Mur ligase family protein [Bacillota bacterium]MDY3923014.1 Mur ligase family protein [Ezakiella sp.]